MNRRTSFIKSFGLFFLGLFAFLGLRWGGFEPYVIPSGSMIPSLLVFDHILVSKYDYGLRVPFSSLWIYGPRAPEHGDVVVFRSLKDPNFFMVKRVIGLPGDELQLFEDGRVSINGNILELSPQDGEEDDSMTRVYRETLPNQRSHLMQTSGLFGYDETFSVPEGHIFLMGDNRDSSQDSRFWGALPLENLLGKARWIWLSCESGVMGQQVLCDPRTIRWHRLLTSIQ